MDQRFVVPVYPGHQGSHILKVRFSRDTLLEVMGVASLQPISAGGILDDLPFLRWSDLPRIDDQGDATLLP